MMELQLAAATLCYFLAHILRAARIQAFLLFRRPAFADVGWAHFYTALLSFVIPFKLGELFRLNAFRSLSGSWRGGIAAFALEKVLDSAAMAGAISLLWLKGGASGSAVRVIGAAAVIVLVGLATMKAINNTLSLPLRKLLLESSRSPRSLYVLRFLKQLDLAWESLKTVAEGRISFLSILTLLIWALELFAFALLGNTTGGDLIARFLESLGGALTVDWPSRIITSVWHQLALVVLIICTLLCWLVARSKSIRAGAEAQPNENTARHSALKRFEHRSD